MQTKEQIEIIIPADLRFSNSIRNFIGDLLQVSGVTEIWINRLILVMDELFMNAVKYGSGDTSKNVYVTIEFTDEEAVFTIEDTGTGSDTIDPKKLEERILQNKEDSSLSKTSGRGLSMIVSNWTTSFRIEKSDHGGIKIITTKSLKDIVGNGQEIHEAPVGDMQNEVAVINFSKKLDVHNSDVEKEMVRTVESMTKAMYIFDLQKINYINSVNIGLLAKLYNIILRKKGKVVIVNMSDTVKDTLNLVGLSDIIPIVENMEEAKKALVSS